ncbi:MAG: nitrilase-related carbon-nitrogen hydrolase [Candidatus Micrarchaeota archaeon]
MIKRLELTKRKTKIGLIQMRMSNSVTENLARTVKQIAMASKKGANIVCLPELFASKYFAQYKKTNERAKYTAEYTDNFERIIDALAKAARDNNIILVGGSVCEKAGERIYNTSIIFDQNGNIIGKYRKVHIPYDECYWEKDYFAPGEEFKVFKTNYGNIGVLICYDQWFPEAARISALMKADIIFYPTAIGTIKGIKQTEGNWKSAWENVMRGHCIANGIFACAVNRIGKEDRITFWGGSFVCDAFGKIIKRAGRNETTSIAVVDLTMCKKIRNGWQFLNNRRSECYTHLLSR